MYFDMPLYEELRSISNEECKVAFVGVFERLIKLGQTEGEAIATTFEEFPVFGAIAKGIENILVSRGLTLEQANREAKGALLGFAILKEIAENQQLKS